MPAADFQPLQGMADIAMPEVLLWQRIEAVARAVFRRYGLQEVRTPILERVGVFSRALGEGTDVVQKEMYAFDDRGGRQVALRPEGTAGVMRYVCAGGQELQDARLFYLGPMFRAERPQAGRRRQFHQVGVECLGPASPAADAECIALQTHLLDELGLGGYRVDVHTRGLPEDRAVVRAGLVAALEPHRDALCEDCRRRYAEHPLRILDCKQEGCRGIVAALPPVMTYMSDAARAHVQETLRLLERMNVPATLNPCLVRGLDYYVHTIWEITHPALGAQDALAGGGRYRIEIGGRALDGVGFALGVERLVMALGKAGGPPPAEPPPAVWLISAGDAARAANLELAQTLRRRGIAAGMDVSGRSMKAQMRSANRAGAPVVLVRGDDELAAGQVVFKTMADGNEERLTPDEAAARLG